MVRQADSVIFTCLTSTFLLSKSQLTKKLDSATSEVNQQRQELWTLEKQRADLASEVEKYKQDNEFMEGEINTLRSTVNEHMQQASFPA
jgi:cell division protein FtsB